MVEEQDTYFNTAMLNSNIKQWVAKFIFEFSVYYTFSEEINNKRVVIIFDRWKNFVLFLVIHSNCSINLKLYRWRIFLHK